jgi:NADH:ubiquinone oxidoreductase subunit 4 (subunit M)
MLSGFWVVVLIALGLAELNDLQNSMPLKELSVIPILALVSGLIASLKCRGEDRFPQFIAYAAVAQMALLWAIQQVFQDFSIWGIQFGLAVAFIMSGLFGVYVFLQQRYGSHKLGKYPGLASSMPRLGILMILLITLAMLLPIFPIFVGLGTLPTFEQSDVSLLAMLLTFSAVWLLGSWYFSHLLHQTAFGKARLDIPYTDLLTSEMGALAILVVGASYSGFVL